MGMGALALTVLLTVSYPAAGVQAAPAPPPWTIEPSPNQPGASDSVLSAVSCVHGGMCMAVGTYYSGSNGAQSMLAERRRHDSWTIEPTPPDNGAGDSLLTGVSCTTPSFCMAVGYSVSSHKGAVVRALAERWNGRAWNAEPTPLPVAHDHWAVLTSVACSSTADCIAVGGYIRNSSSAQEQPLAESWDGTTWSLLGAPNPHAENGSAFTAVACAASDACEVVGDYDYADVAQSVFAYGYDGSAWVSQKQVNPAGQEYNSDSAVSCVSAAACTSVGSWFDSGPLGLAERWDGSTWSRQRVRQPAGSATDEFEGVSCAAVIACVAVGDSAGNLNDYPTATLAEVWDGTTWRILDTPDPAGASSALLGVSCVEPSTCVAVGNAFAGKMGSTLVETSS